MVYQIRKLLNKGISFDSIKREIKINDKAIDLTSIQYCYYYYFALRAKSGKQFIPMPGDFAPEELSREIKKHHEQIFPDAKRYRKDMDESMVNGKPVNLMTTVRAHISKINKRIHQVEYRIISTGQRGMRSYGVPCPQDQIQMSTTSVIPTFTKNVFVFTDNDSLPDVLVFMNKNQYSQVVVKKGHRLFLLTPESILVWLQNEVIKRKRMIDLSYILLSNIPYEIDSPSVAFYRPERTVDEARKEFYIRFNENAPRLSAIIITSNGLSNGEPLGIITPWDFIDKKYW